MPSTPVAEASRIIDKLQSLNSELELGPDLTVSLSRPGDVAAELMFSPFFPIAAKIALEMNLLELLVEHGGDITSGDLADQSSAEGLLITRLLRALAAAGLLADVGDRKRQATAVREAMVVEGVAAGFKVVEETTLGAAEQLIDGSDPVDDSALLVDIGGGLGHDILAFHDKYPNNGKLILQDLPDVIKNCRDLPPDVEAMGYDFFTDQPAAKDARAYFYHSILHDWSDYKCDEILTKVREAMKPGYSKLYIHEIIVPETTASPYVAMLDLTMTCFNAGMERTARRWGALLGNVGLRVTKIWPPPEEGAGGIVEAVLKDEDCSGRP
ncbi:sterigmatocystin 8-O-methyltransferase [Xylaria palmicola]|nr:sterigmatocystin 8-O-methyltransferase [Xylaria palmicola]